MGDRPSYADELVKAAQQALEYATGRDNGCVRWDWSEAEGRMVMEVRDARQDAADQA